MTRYARRGHHDGNHAEIAQAYEDMGCSVVDTTAVGWGYGDLTIGLLGQTHICECKLIDGEIGPTQKVFARDWRGSKIVYVRTVDDAIAHVRAIRKAAKALEGAR